MSETPSSAQRSASVAKLANNERLHLMLVAGGIIFALALAVVMLRLYRLTELPPGLFPDEGAHGVDALRVLQGEHAVFFSEIMDAKGMIVYAVAVPISLLGRTALAVRLPTALASAGTVFVVFWLGRLLFGRDEKGQATPWRGLLVGGVGAGLLAVSIGQTVLGRTAFRANFLPLLSFPVSGLALVGVAGTELMADRAGRRVRGAAAVHLYSGAFHAFSFSLVWFDLSAALSFWRQEAGSDGASPLGASQGCTTESICISGHGRAGGRAPLSLFCTASRTFLYARQIYLGLRSGS